MRKYLVLLSTILVILFGCDQSTNYTALLDENSAFKITYKLDDGINHEDNPFLFIADYPVILKEPTKDGYIFEGWYEDSDFSGSPIKGWFAGDKTWDVTLYAKWRKSPRPIKKVTVSFNANRTGIAEPQPIEVVADRNADLPKIEDSKFSHWNTKPDGSGDSYQMSGIFSDSVTLYAIQLPKNTLRIIYMLDGGINNKENPLSFRRSDRIELKDPTRKDYIFLGWYDDKGNLVKDWNGKEKNADVTLYAKWKGETVYSYTLNIEDISTIWGGSTTSPKFSVMLLTEEQVDACFAAEDFKQASEDMPEYQIFSYNDMRIGNTAKKGDFGVFGFMDNEYKYYDGVAASITDTTFTLTVDMTKLAKTQLKAHFATNANGENERFLTESDTLNLEGYKPYVIALGQKEKDEENYIMTAWSGDMMKMTPGAIFPADLQYVYEAEMQTITITADEIENVISSLSFGAYKIVITGEMDSKILSRIKDRMKWQTAVQFYLDLSDTKGLASIEGFSGCENLIGFAMPDTVTSISFGAFEGCSNLKDVIIGNNVTYIDIAAFAECTSLVSVTIPGSVTEIACNAFRDCNSLTSVIIPSRVTRIQNEVFRNCNNLTNITFEDTNNWCYTSNCDYTGGTAIDVTDSAQNAEYFKGKDYSSYYWYKDLGISSINIKSYPTKVSYSVGDEFDVSGLEIEAVNFDGSVSVIEVTSGMIGGFDTYRTGIQKLTITYGNCTTTFEIEVVEIKPASINIKSKPAKTSYFTGEELDLSGIQIEAVYSDGSTSVIISDIIVNGFDSSIVGTQTLTVTYGGCTATFEVEVKNLILTADEVANVIAGLSSGTHTIKMTGKIDNNTISSITTAMSRNRNAKIILDLSDTTGLPSIDGCAFWECDNLISITLPDGLTSIGGDAFTSCSNLINVVIPESVTEIGNDAFKSCSSLISAEIPDGVTTIGSNMFYGCSSLENVTISNGVTSIGNRAFYECWNLKSITIPASVTSIGDEAFYGCGLCDVIFEDVIGWYCTNNSDYTGGTAVDVTDTMQNAYNLSSSSYYWYKKQASYVKVTADDVMDVIENLSDGIYTVSVTGEISLVTLSNIKAAMKNNTSAQITLDLSEVTGLTSIHDSAFKDHENLIGVIIPDSVTSIGNNAFENCNRLTKVEMPNSVTAIGSYAFINCYNLRDIIIPDGVISIGDYAFNNDTNMGWEKLIDVIIPASVTSIGYEAFGGYYNITVNTDDKYLYSDDGTKILLCDSSLVNIEISDSVTSIAAGAFSHCRNVETIVTGNGLTSLSELPKTSKLKSITIGDNVTSISSNAFSGCRSLTNITIGDSVTSIGDSAFYNCSSLTNVTIPDNVTSIGSNTFSGCSSLTSVTIGNSVISIGSNAFSGCNSLRNVTFMDTSTWYYTGETEIDVTNTSNNAAYLRDIYSSNYWYKK